MSTRLMRGEEEAGRYDLLLAGQTTRRCAAGQALVGLGAGVLGLFALTTLGAIVTGRSLSAGFSLVGLSRETRQLPASWLEENRARLGQTPVLAAIGYFPGDQSRHAEGTFGAQADNGEAVDVPSDTARVPYETPITAHPGQGHWHPAQVPAIMA